MAKNLAYKRRFFSSHVLKNLETKQNSNKGRQNTGVSFRVSKKNKTGSFPLIMDTKWKSPQNVNRMQMNYVISPNTTTQDRSGG